MTAVIKQLDIEFSVRPVVKMLCAAVLCTNSTDLS